MPSHNSTACRAFTLSATLLTAAVLGCGSSRVEAAPAFALRPGVIVDKSTGVAYVGNPKGSIEAVDLKAGRTLWTSGEAALPLAAEGRLLVAQAEENPPRPRLRIVVLDVARGRKVSESVTDLPPEVRALVSDDLNRSFRVTVERDQRGFRLAWSSRETIVQGIARAPGEPLPQRTFSGTVHVDVPGSRAPAPRRESRDVTLAKKALVTLPSADGRHVLLSDRVGAGGPKDPEYLWSIFAADSGRKIGEVRQDVSAAPFFVWKDYVVFQAQPHGFLGSEGWVDVPLQIVAIRLASGERAWSRAVRDLEYRGPAPPAP